jgi:hypothetical protein
MTIVTFVAAVLATLVIGTLGVAMYLDLPLRVRGKADAGTRRRSDRAG